MRALHGGQFFGRDYQMHGWERELYEEFRLRSEGNKYWRFRRQI